MAIGEASVRIVPDLEDFAEKTRIGVTKALGGIDKAVEKTTDNIDKEFEKAGKEAEKSVAGIGDEFKKLGKLVAGAAISKAIFNFAKSSIDAASDLGESINAVQVTFGDLSDEILAFSKVSAKSVGLASADFNSFAVRFAGFTKQIASGNKDAADVTKELTTRIADFASVMNLDLNDAATVFASTLAGESEAIRRFGIDMSAASIEAFALKEGLISSKDEMTASIKVQATYAKLMADTAQVQGDFANTSDSLANRQRILAAEFKNLQVEVGTALVPVMESLLSVVGPVFDGFNALPGTLQKSVTYAVLAGGAFLGLSNALQGVGISARTANLLLGKIGIALTGVAAVFSVFSKTMNIETDEAFGSLTDAIKQNDRALRNAALLQLAEDNPEIRQNIDLWGQFGITIDDLGEYFRTGEGPATAYKDALQKLQLGSGELEDKIKRINEAFGTNFDVSKMSREEMENVADAAANLQAEIFGLDQDMMNASSATDALSSALGETGSNAGLVKIKYNQLNPVLESSTALFQAQEEAINDLLTATLALFNNEIQYEQAKRNTVDAIDAYNVLLKSIETGTYDGANANRDLAESQEEVYLQALAQAQAVSDVAEETAIAAGEAFTASQKTEIQRLELEKIAGTLAPGSPLRVQLDDYIRRLGEIPRNISTDVRITVTESGRAYAVTPYGAMPLDNYILPQTAVGGIFSQPEARLIAEAGAEAVIPLTRPQRALELMQESGLLAMVQQASPTASQNFDIKVLSAEPMRTAKDVVREFQAVEYRMSPI